MLKAKYGKKSFVGRKMKPTNIIYLNIDINIKTNIVERGDFDNIRS